MVWPGCYCLLLAKFIVILVTKSNRMGNTFEKYYSLKPVHKPKPNKQTKLTETMTGPLFSQGNRNHRIGHGELQKGGRGRSQCRGSEGVLQGSSSTQDCLDLRSTKSWDLRAEGAGPPPALCSSLVASGNCNHSGDFLPTLHLVTAVLLTVALLLLKNKNRQTQKAGM